MRLSIFVLTASVALVSCNKQGQASENAASEDSATAAAPAETAPASSINETSYEYSRDGKAMQLSVDASGNYVIQSGADHVDHGTVVSKDGKVCFTTAMAENKGKDGCWTDAKLEVGQTGDTTSDSGEKLTITRVEYKPAAM